MSNLIRIKIFRTEGEFEYIDGLIQKMGRQDFNKYLQTELRKLANTYRGCPNCITTAKGDKIERVVRVDEGTHFALSKLSLQMRKGHCIGSVADELVITPLLLPGMA